MKFVGNLFLTDWERRQFEKEAFPEMNKIAKQFQDAKAAGK